MSFYLIISSHFIQFSPKSEKDFYEYILKVAPESEQEMQKTLGATETLCSVIVIQRVPKYAEKSLNYYVLKIALKDVGAL